jgi:leucyl aminopeptidase
MEFQFNPTPFTEFRADALILDVFENELTSIPWLSQLNKTTADFVLKQLTEREFTGKTGETFSFSPPPQLPIKHLILVGLGEKSKCSPVVIRQAAASAIQKARELRVQTLATTVLGVASGSLETEQSAQMMTEGFMMGSYLFLRYKTTQKVAPEVSTVIYLAGAATGKAEKGSNKGEAIATAVLNARDIINEPPSKIKPIHLAKAAEEIASLSRHMSVTVLDEAKLKKENYAALLAVAAGSEEKPYLIHLHYKPVKASKKVAFVGKGVTFDSGGLGLKPWNHMLGMKTDMAGAANVLGIFQAIAELETLGLPVDVEVHGVIAAAENMISGKAMRPDDIIETKSGKTIEILHTDAEGRLILSDALTFAVALKPDYIIDYATLTGSAINALGRSYSAYMGNDRTLLSLVERSSQETGELAWELPLPEIYKKTLESSVADLQNIHNSPLSPGAIYGGLFLQEFVDGRPWVHLDIAGPSFTEEDTNPVYPKGATGYGILLGLKLLELL